MEYKIVFVVCLVGLSSIVEANHFWMRNGGMRNGGMPMMQRPIATTTPKPTTTTPAGEYEPPEIEGPVSTSTTAKPTTTQKPTTHHFPYRRGGGNGFHFGRRGHFNQNNFGRNRVNPPTRFPPHQNFGGAFKPNARTAMQNSVNNGGFPKRGRMPQFQRGGPPPAPSPTGKWIEIGPTNLRMGSNNRNSGRQFPARGNFGQNNLRRRGGQNGRPQPAPMPTTVMGLANTRPTPGNNWNRGGNNQPRNGNNQPRNGNNQPRNGNNQPRNGPNSWPQRQQNRVARVTQPAPTAASNFGRGRPTFPNRQNNFGGGQQRRDFGNFGGGRGMARQDVARNAGWLNPTNPTRVPTSPAPTVNMFQSWNTPRNPPMPNPPPPSQRTVTRAPKTWQQPVQTTTVAANSFTDVWGYPTTAASNWFLGNSKNINANSNVNSLNKPTTTVSPFPATQAVVSNDPFIGMFGGMRRMFDNMMVPRNPLMNYMVFAS